MEWISKCDKLPKDGEYVYVYPPYLTNIFDDEPRHVVRWRDGCFVYYLCGSVHTATWGEITHWMPLPPPPSSHNSDSCTGCKHDFEDGEFIADLKCLDCVNYDKYEE